MSRLTQIHIHGFRRLRDVKLEMRPLCVMIGANGCGKTSVLDVFALLAASMAGKLKGKLSEHGGLQSVLTADKSNGIVLGHSGTPPELSVGVEAQAPRGGINAVFGASPVRLSYALKLRQVGIGYQIAEESLEQQGIPEAPSTLIGPITISERPKLTSLATITPSRPISSLDPAETVLAQMPGMVPEVEWLRTFLYSVESYHALNVEPRAPIRLPQQLQPAELPGADAEDLMSCLYQLRETDRGRFDAIEDALRSAFPGFKRLDFPTVASGMVAMIWRDQNFSRPFYMNQLSEGTLRFLWLATLLQSPGLPAITLIDEPEVSLHPELLSLLAGLMREASTRTQLIVATHSDRLIRALEPKEVVTFDLQDDGTSSAAWADQHDLDEWLKEYTLDEVWRMGRIGGQA
jgi:predicted ATPase